MTKLAMEPAMAATEIIARLYQFREVWQSAKRVQEKEKEIETS